ncbi:MAG TPA: ABC transporter permease [Candidatus Acidoferrales bacterium]|nr:ABC transporter permease [Candidatus Acidoferrales bacterium]
MRKARAWLWRLGGLFGRKRSENELAAELESHLALHVEDNLRAGMAPTEARRQALVKLGGLEQAKELYRERRGIPALETLGQDLRYGARMLRASPGFTLVAILTLALGIGANSAIFSVVNAVLLHTLPFLHPERLVNITEMEPFLADAPVASADFCDWKAQSASFDHVVAVVPFRGILTGDGPPAELTAMGVSTDFLPMLGIEPVLGRGFSPEEDSPAHRNVVILSYEFWRDRFGSDPGVIGRTIALGGQSKTVIGVLPADLNFGYPSPQLLAATSCQVKPMATRRGNHFMDVWARLKPGVSVRQAQAEMDTIAARLARQYPDSNAGEGVHVQPLSERFAAPARAALLLLLGAVAFVLLIACVNVANLQVVRASARRKEVAVRAALGATRGRLVRQLLTENLLLGLSGGAMGLLFSAWGVEALKLGLPPDLTGTWKIGIDGTVVAFAFALAVLASVLFGLAPAIDASRVSLNAALGSAGRLTAGLASHRLRSLLVVAETALALVLLVGAGLMFRSFLLLSADYPGFNPHGALTMRVDLPSSKYPKDAQQAAFFQQALARVRALPGVVAAGGGSSLPGQNNSSTELVIVGRPAPPSGRNPLVGFTIVTPGYFAAAELPLLRGRLFIDADTAGSAPAVIVDQRLARTYFARRDAIGQQLHIMGKDRVTIVGVVGNVKEHGFNENMPELYLPEAQFPGSSLALVVRSAGNPMALAAGVAGAIRATDTDQPVDRVQTLEQVYEAVLLGSRLNAFLLVSFGLLALVLAAVGTYGVISFAAGQRTQEMGIRMVLGASRTEILKLVMNQGARLSLVGVAIGIAGALALTHLMASVLFEVKPTDPTTFAGAATALMLAALGASWLPALRAMNTEPAAALRHE